MMLIEIYIGYAVALAIAAIGSLLVTRVTEKPIRIGWVLNESAANTFTTQTLAIPGVPSIAITRGATKSIGLEVMSVVTELEPANLEAGQNNSSTAELSKGAAPTALRGVNNNLTIHRRRRDVNSTEVTAVGEMSLDAERVRFDDMSDHDGNGELVLDNELHVSVLGAGNASTMIYSGYILAHLVEFDASEAVFEIIEQAS